MNNYDATRFFINLVEEGVLVIRDNGSVWALKEKRNQYEYHDILPKRIDKLNNFGYQVLQIRRNGNCYKCFSHRLVWCYFNYKNEVPVGYQINHKDGIRHNNHKDNLELVTPSENIIHSIKVLGRTFPVGENHHNALLTNDAVREIKKKLARSEERR